MVRRLGRCVATVVAAGALWSGVAIANPCRGPTFGYGNAGYAAGYGIAGCGVRPACGVWSGGGVCGPRWGGCNRVGGWPDACGRGGWWFGRPGFGFGGWCGASRWRGCESVYFSAPSYGGATFFSGCVTPFVTGVGPVFGGWPANWYPGYAVGPAGWYPYAVPAPVGVGPQFGPAGILPFLGASTGRNPGTVAAATPRGPAPPSRPAMRLVNDASRRRAERLVATGDRHLRAARDGVPARARAALDAYRRAAASAPDDPDTRVREALALVALGDAVGADAALVRATAIDGRLAAAPRRGDLPADPVFGDRPVNAPAPLAARGAAILREIGGAEAADVAWLAARWGVRWGGGAAAAVASR